VLGDAVVSWASVGIAATAIVLAAAFALFFSRTDLGLLFLGLSERRDIAGMLGVPTRRLSMIAWMIAAVISVLVGVLLAPTALLSRDMMEPYMLLAFTAVVIGGLTSLYGVFVGGIIVGVVNNLMSLYFSSDAAVLAVFVLLLLVLGFRPQGIFGDREIERL
jgi:branched-chain amino acid transport system permease protein